MAGPQGQSVGYGLQSGKAEDQAHVFHLENHRNYFEKAARKPVSPANCSCNNWSAG